MRIFNLHDVVLGLPEERLGGYLGAIESLREKTADANKMANVGLLRAIARQSGAVASCACGNVFISNRQEEDLFEKGKEPSTFQTYTVMGYAKALDAIEATDLSTELSVSFISNLHYLMYEDYNPDFGGKLKDQQNYIQEGRRDGSFRKVFVPVSPEETYPMLDNLIYQFNLCAKDEEVNKLELICIFLLHFIAIHPYNHGNGRLSRLLLHFLLKKFGYDVDSYYSIAYLLDKQVGSYLDAFMNSTDRWNDGENDPLPFVSFLLKTIRDAYAHLDYIMEINKAQGKLEDKVFRIIYDASTPISFKVIASCLYDTPKADLEKTINELIRGNRIHLIERGYETRYAAN